MNTQDEIERCFLTTSLKWLSLIDENQYRHIHQGYPPTLQEEEGEFSRICATSQQDGSFKYELYIKGLSDGPKSLEDVQEITEVEARKYFKSCIKQTLIKKLYGLPLGDDPVVEIGRFIYICHEYSKLVISKVRFDTIEEAQAFVPPDWIGEEITGDHKWSNFSLCINGEPK
ncbi:MAG: CYTH domain-containing protein [Candidatus Paceibacteria bacterium]|jgi:CYTH domain-containing protein